MSIATLNNPTNWGGELRAKATIDQWKKAAGMNFNVDEGRLTFTAPDGKIHDIVGQKALHRSDTKNLLGIVSDGYNVVQPGEVLEFFRDLCANNEFELERAGTFFNGKKFFALAKIGADAEICSTDKLLGYLLLASSADGSLRTTATFTSIRPICNNTLSMAVREAKGVKGAHRVAVSHRSIFKADTVKEDLGIVREQFSEMVDACRKMSKTRVTKDTAADFVAKLLSDSNTIASKDPTSTRSFKAIMELFEGAGKGAELKGVDGTAWGLVNSITEYVDHHQKKESLEHRINDALFGRGQQLKTFAAERAMELVR